MALPPGAIGSAVREEKLAWGTGSVKSAFPICSNIHLALSGCLHFLLASFSLE
jgi:hypothetical protein